MGISIKFFRMSHLCDLCGYKIKKLHHRDHRGHRDGNFSIRIRSNTHQTEDCPNYAMVSDC
jgi:hypothetical protein